MSWLFSQALVAEYSADTCLDGEQSAQSSGNHTQLAFLPPDKMTAFSRLSRFGMTFKPLTEDRGAALLKSCLADFRARTSAQPEKVPASTESAAECGSTWQELSVKYCLASSSWKTHHYLWEEDLPWSSVTLPRWGMTRSGLLFQHPTLERPINANVSGLWQTPVADDSCNRATGKWNSRGEPKLSAQVLCPTPCSRDYRSGKGKKQTDRGRTAGMSLSEAQDGLLNPPWVEWLMGWPLGWTDLKPLATDRFREWQQQHSIF